MRAFLIEIQALDSAGDPLTLRLASHDDVGLTGYSGEIWWPAIAQLPAIGYDFFDGGFRGDILLPAGSFVASTAAIPAMPTASLADAAIIIRMGELSNFVLSGVETIFTGRVVRQPEFSEGRMTVQFGVNSRWLNEPLLATYAGDGGIEGPDELESVVKPLMLGNPRFAGGVLIDPVENIFQLSAYGPIEGISAAYDRLSSLGASFGDYANLAALTAAAIPSGSWGTCRALGLVRHGAPPDGQTCYHVSGDNSGGHSELPGEIIARIADIAGGTVSSAALTALDVARPWPLSLVLLDQITAGEVIQSIAASIKAVALISWLGELVVLPVALGTSSATMNSDGSTMPAVGTIAQLPVDPPFWRLATQAQRSWVVHDRSDIAFDLNFRGEYKAGRVYRQDDVVSLEDGSSWVYVGTVPLAGSYPTEDNPNWAILSSPTSLNAIGGNPVTSGPFPPFTEYTLGDVHIDDAGRRWIGLAEETAAWTIDGVPVTIDGEPIYSGWRRADAAARLGGIGGLTVENSTGDRMVDTDLMNIYRRTLVVSSQVTIQTDTSGDIQTELPLIIPVTAKLGSVDVSADTSFSATFPAAITGTIDTSSTGSARGDITLTDIQGAGVITVTANFTGGLSESAQVQVDMVTGQQPITGGSSATMVEDRTWLNVTSGSYAQITDQPLVLASDGSGNLKFRYFASFTAAAEVNVEVIARYRTEGSGGAWSDAGTSAVGVGTELEPEFLAYVPGFVSKAEFTQAMGAAATAYEVSLWAKRVSGSATVTFNNSNSLFLVKQ